MALANTITLDPGTGIPNPFTGAPPANLQEHINNEALQSAIVSFLFTGTTTNRTYDSPSSSWKQPATQMKGWYQDPGGPDPTSLAAVGDLIVKPA